MGITWKAVFRTEYIRRTPCYLHRHFSLRMIASEEKKLIGTEKRSGVLQIDSNIFQCVPSQLLLTSHREVGLLEWGGWHCHVESAGVKTGNTRRHGATGSLPAHADRHGTPTRVHGETH